MAYKKLISPEFKVTFDKYVLESGMDIECFSSKYAKSDWCKIELTTQLKDMISYEDMEEVKVELGYNDDYDTLLTGYAIKNDTWKEIIIKDEMIKLERVTVKNTFIECMAQDIVRYILTQAGITKYILSSKNYGTRKVSVFNHQDGVKALIELNSLYGINCCSAY